MAVLAISLTACSAGGKLTPTSKKVNGPLGKFFEVVERDYKMTEYELVYELSVEFKRIAKGGPTDASWSSKPTFTVELLDEDGNSITSEHTDVVFSEKQLEAVFSLGIDETATITFRFFKNMTKGAVKFKVSSKWLDGDGSDNSSEVDLVETTEGDLSDIEVDDDSYSDDNDSDSDVDTSSSSGSEDWNALLDSYENYVDKYISYMKKAAKGDMSALSEYPSLMEKAQEFSDKMKNAQGEMSSSQWARYMKITTKMSKAAMEMQ